MPFCNKCGTRLTSEDLFCPKCGSEPAAATVSENTVAEAASVPEMTKEESVALAKRLSKEYAEMEKVKKQIDENEAIISRPVPEPARHSAFKFFLPFLISAPIAFSVLYSIGYIALQSGNRTVNMVFSFLAVLVLAGLLIFGGRWAKNKRDDMNSLEIAKQRTQVGKMDDLKKKTGLLKTKFRTLQNSVKPYDSLVPAECRTSQKMEKVVVLLEADKAKDFTSALKL